MDLEILDFMFKHLFNLTSIPVQLYDGDALFREYTFQKYWLPLHADIESIRKSEEPVAIRLTKQSLIYGCMGCKETSYSMVFGPVKAIPLSHRMLQDIMLENDLPTDSYGTLEMLASKLPTISLEYFAVLLSLFYCEINHSVIQPKQILDQVQFNSSLQTQDPELLVQQEQIVFGDKAPHNTYEYEKKMLYCVRNGLVEDLHKMGSIDSESRVEISSANPLQHYKNLLMAQKTLISRAAIDGGVDPETAFSLSDIYTHQIESSSSLREINSISYSMRDQYCKLVRDIKRPKTSDMTVNRAISYIIEHIHEKMSTDEIAEDVGVSREYLSSKFKKNTGMSIPDYINEQKIFIARKLLKFSDKSLIEIANFLSYSSQSYFQTQFKKITGMTPLEYRNTK